MVVYPASVIPTFPIFTSMRGFSFDTKIGLYKFKFANGYGATVRNKNALYYFNVLINDTKYYNNDISYCDEHGIDKMLCDIEALPPGSLDEY